MNYELVFAHNVIIKTIDTGIEVTINDKHTAIFAEMSNVTQLFRKNGCECVARLTGGSYFYINDQLVDHRDSTYVGYIMSESDIEELMNTIGYSANLSLKDLKGLHLVNSGRSDYALIKDYSKKGMSLGAVTLYHVWSPFSNNIRFSYKLTVEEGDVFYNRPLKNRKISIISSNWYDELKLQSDNCINELVNLLEKKFNTLKIEKCNVREVTDITEHAVTRSVDEIVNSLSLEYMHETGKKPDEGDLTRITKLVAWQYVIELIQYDTIVGDGKLYQLANNLMWSK